MNLNSTYYQHQYGGIYKFDDSGRSTIDSSVVVIYQHIYPFDVSVWVRPHSEFTDGRFRELSIAECDIELQKPQKELRKFITDNKNNKTPLW